LAPRAAREFEHMPTEVRSRTRQALLKLASGAASKRRIGGKAVKTIHGPKDAFHRLRVGDYRVMYDVLDHDRVILVLGIVHRGDLERWIRSR
jgi:mRNA-degrading endonuclease RelE of RelBE toxin-antitoxin system